MLFTIFLIIAGLVILYLGGEVLVHGSVKIAKYLRVSSIIIGVTVVAYGTSMPEASVSVVAAIRKSSSIAIGNLVGSNILNIALILGVSALVRPICIKGNKDILNLELPFMLGSAALALLLGLDNEYSRLDGLIITVLFLVFNFLCIMKGVKQSRKLRSEEKEKESSTGNTSVVLNIVYVIAGIALLIWGANLLVKGGIQLAQMLGWSERLIALTIIALGSSLPELSTSLVASIRNSGDISIGNVVGSNIFNISGILGISTMFTPLVIEEGFVVDVSWMFGLSLLLFPMLKMGYRISRPKAALLLGIYCVYFFFVIL